MDVTGQFSDGYIVRGFLELEDLLVDELALFVDDKIGIERALGRVFARLGGASTGTGKRDSCKATGDGNVLRMLTIPTLNVERCGFRG